MSGPALHALVAELYPVPRSITGEGLRTTLRRLKELLPGLRLREVPSGTPVLDWTVPDEWNVRDAYVADATGRRVIDWQAHRLHLVGYSEPVRARMPLRALRPHLHTLPDRPDLVPYRTSYYERTWGFCLAHRTLEAMERAGEDAEYEVVIDATLAPGSLTYGELVIPGETDREVLISAHACHPQLANDNLAGVAVAAFLARELLEKTERRYTYRFLFAPGTIGAIAWLARNEERLGRIAHGLVLATLGDGGPFVYKRSRRGTLGGDLPVDRAVAHVLRHSGHPWEARDFSPYGYDERQYGAPAFDLPVGRLSRTPHGEFFQYHTSGDDLALVTPEALAASLAVLRRVVDVLEGDVRYCNPTKGEPMLGRRGLYRALGGHPDPGAQQTAMLWVLNLSDGRHGLLDVAERARLPFEAVREAADRLVAHGLLTPLT